MNKKIIIALLATTLILGTGCFRRKGKSTSDSGTNTSSQNVSGGNNSNHSSTPVSELPSGTDVTIYLNLGEIGLYNGQKGQDYPEMFLENAIKLETTVGAALPGKDVITSTSGAEFQNWMAYEGDGAPTKYETAPGFNNKILLANFSGGSGSGGGGGGSSQQTGEYTYTCTNLPDWITNDGCVIFAWVWSPNDTGSWKSASYGSPATSLTFEVTEELTGFLLARCAAGTTQPDWNVKGTGAGRVYNQTNNIDCQSGTYSYECASWKEYNPA